MNRTLHAIELSGLDGGNSLGFLATLGVLRCLDWNSPENQPKVSWTAHLRPQLHCGPPFERAKLVDTLLESVQTLVNDGVAELGDIIGVPVSRFQTFANPSADGAQSPRKDARLLFAAAYGSDAVTDPKKGTIVPTALSFSNGQGGKMLLKDFRSLASRLTAKRIDNALFAPWLYDDENEPTFRWDALDMRTGAHMATDPGSTTTRSVMAANALAFVGLSFLCTIPAGGGLHTTAIRQIDGQDHLVWPLWCYPLSADVVGSLLQQSSYERARGVIAVFASQRIMFKKNLYLGPSKAI